jgi:hypothetical protein
MGYEFLTESRDKSKVHPVNISEEHLPGLSVPIKASPKVPSYLESESIVKLDGKPPLDMPHVPASPHGSDGPLSGSHPHRRQPANPLSPISPLHHAPPVGSPDWKTEGAGPDNTEWPSATSPPKHGHHTRASVGADDLYPSPHHSISPLEPLGPGGGMLMGPDHPVFFGQEEGGSSQPPNFLGGGVRDARYDPTMPPVATGTGLDPDLFGGDDLSRPSRGKPNNKKKLLPGEPNPDHLKPPSWNNSSGFM